MRHNFLAAFAALLALPLTAQTINPNQIRPGTANGEVLTTVTANQPPSWQPSFTLSLSTNSTPNASQSALNFSNTTPAAPAGYTNVLWQNSGGNESAYVPTGTSGSGALGFIPLWTPNGTTLGNSHLDDGVTTAGQITSSEQFNSTISNANAFAFYGTNNGTATNFIPTGAFICPNVSTSTVSGCVLNVGKSTSFADALGISLEYRYGGSTAANRGALSMGTTGNDTPALMWDFSGNVYLPQFPNLSSLATDANGKIIPGSGSSLTLTTTGTTGAATYSGGTLNIPQYQGALTLTTTGTTGVATLTGNTLNIPNYAAGSSGVSSINSTTGAFTFAGSGVSCTGTTCTFSGAGTSDALPAYGSLVSFSSGAFSTTGWTANGTTPTVTGGNLVFSGGAGTFTQSYDRTTIGSSSAYNTTLPAWTASETITVGTVSSTSFGLGIGIRSTASLGSSAPYSLVCRIDLSTSASGGEVIIDEFNGSGTATQVAISPALTFAAGDSIVLTLNRNYSQLTCTASDLTTATQPSGVASYTMPYTSGTTVLGPNVGHFAIFNLGGTQTVTAFSVNSAAPVGAQLAYVGDSKVAGYFQGSAFSNPYSTAQTSVTLAGGGETTDDVTANLPEIVALAPKNIILDIGRNNFCLGSDSVATTETKYQTLVTTLLGDGFNVWNLLTWEPSCANLATFDSWIAANYASWTGTGTSYLIDPKLQNYGGTSASGTAISSDGIHPNAQGAYYITQAINAALIGQSTTNKFIPQLPPVPQTSAAATAGHAACVKSINPVVIGYCSTQPDTSGACTCN